MFLFPIGHGETIVRRWPWVTTGIVLLNVLIHIALFKKTADAERDFASTLAPAIELLTRNPDLKAPPTLKSLLRPKDRKALEALETQRSENQLITPERKALFENEQALLDRLDAQLAAIRASHPAYRFGYRPKDKNVAGLFSHQFLHAGFFHLFGNMWFLWLVGCNVEDGWGRILFPAFYVSAGVVAALSQGLIGPPSEGSLIGASGAVAGAMGAFLVRHATTKIKFVGLLLWKPVKFLAPAFLMLPLWLLEQVASGLIDEEGHGGVAYFAHVGGFVYGLLYAFAFKWSGMEKRIGQAIDDQGAVFEDPVVGAAARDTDAGRPGAAITKLETVLAAEPKRMDALLELLRASSSAGDTGREVRTKVRLIELYLQQSAPESALLLYQELGDAQRRTGVPAPLRLRIARHYERVGRSDLAVQEFRVLYGDNQDRSIALSALIAHAELAIKLGRRQDALLLWERAESYADPALASVVDNGLARARAMS